MGQATKGFKLSPWKVLANHLLSPVVVKQFSTQIHAFQKGSDKRTNDLPLFYKENTLSVKVLRWAKMPHDLCGTISLYIQNLRTFTMTR